MKKILIPTDFSDCANAATNFALEFAKKNNSQVDFLHLLSTPVDWVKLPLEKEKLYPETRKEIGQAKAKLSELVRNATHKGLMATQSLMFNKDTDEVLHHLQQRDCELVIMGSHGIKGLKENLIGSNTQQIIRHSDVPVLVVKNDIQKPIKNIVFVSDFKDVSVKSFHTITHFADIIEGHIDLLFVNTPKEFMQSIETDRNMESLLTHCSRLDACTKHIINAQSVENGVKEFIKDKSKDMVAICTHGKSGIKQLFSPSIAESLANHLDILLLSIKI